MRGDAMKTAHRGQKQPLPRDMTTILISIKIRIDLLFIKYHYDAVNQIKVNQYGAVNQVIVLLRLWRLKTTWVKSKINRCVSWGATPHGVLLIPYTDDFCYTGYFFAISFCGMIVPSIVVKRQHYYSCTRCVVRMFEGSSQGFLALGRCPPHIPRETYFTGRILSHSSCDGIPQLCNIQKGTAQ